MWVGVGGWCLFVWYENIFEGADFFFFWEKILDFVVDSGEWFCASCRNSFFSLRVHRFFWVILEGGKMVFCGGI